MKDYTFIIKHILRYAIYFVGFLIICMIFDYIDSKNKAVNIIEIVFISFYLVIGATYFIYSLIKHDREIYKIQKEREGKFNYFLDILETFNYETSTKEDKIKYLLASLYEASSNYTMCSFYARCFAFSRVEIKELLYNEIDAEFNEFINDIVLKFKGSPQIALFRYRVISKINKTLGLEEGYYSDATYNFRMTIYRSGKKYNILKERCSDNKWNKVRIDKGFNSFDDAYLIVTRTINYLNDDLRKILTENAKSEINLETFKEEAHTYKLALNQNRDEIEFSLFRLYYFLKFKDFKYYKLFINKNKYNDFEILNSNYPKIYNKLNNYYKTKKEEDLKKLYETLKEEIDKHIVDDKFRIEEDYEKGPNL